MKCLVGTFLIVYLCGTLAGCGQKGPLTLPDAPKRKHSIPTLAPQATPNGTTGSPAPAESSSSTAPAPPATPTPPPSTTPRKP